MILENTPANKTKYFALYLYQQVEVYQEGDDPHPIILTPEQLMKIDCGYYDHAKLILKPIKEITDEHVAEFEKMYGQNIKEILTDFNLCVYRHSIPKTIDMIDYLRIRGYATEYDAHKYVEYGWVKE